MIDKRYDGAAVEALRGLREIGEVHQTYLSARDAFHDARRLDVEALHDEIGFRIRTALNFGTGGHAPLILKLRQGYGADDGIGIRVFVTEDLNALGTGRRSHERTPKGDGMTVCAKTLEHVRSGGAPQ